MMAIISMALVSCGGGSGNGIKLANPAILYYHNVGSYQVDITNCLLVKNLDVMEKDNEIVVTAQFEMVKEPEAPIQYVFCDFNLLDENEHEIAGRSTVIEIAKEGEIVNWKGGLNLKDIKGDMSIDSAFKKAKFVMFDYVAGRRIRH